MRSDLMKTGVDRIPHRALFRALGLTDEELSRPIIGVVSAKNEIIPGHMHLDKIAEVLQTGLLKLIVAIGTIIGSHSGPGTVAVFFLGDERPTMD